MDISLSYQIIDQVIDKNHKLMILFDFITKISFKIIESKAHQP